MCGTGQSTLQNSSLSMTDFQKMSLENPNRRKTIFLNYLDNQNENEEITSPALFYEDSFKFFNLEPQIDTQYYRFEEYYDPLKSYFEIKFTERYVQIKQEDYGMTGNIRYFNY